MKSRSYWTERFKALENRQNRSAAAAYADVEPAFDKAQTQINKEIEYWYQRIANNNEISLADAKKLLTKNELKEFHWSVEDYIKFGQENAVDPKWIKELENASAKFHISRLEALKINTQQQLEVAFGNQLDSIDQMARNVYQDEYYRTAFEIMKGNEVGFVIGSIDTKKLDQVVHKPWAFDGSNFSDRIWISKDQMVNALHQEMTRTFIMGGSPDAAIASMTAFLADKTNGAKRKAARLIQTEQAYFTSAAQKDCFKDLGVEEFEIVASLDAHTCEICGAMDGQHAPMTDFQSGVTAPPFHPFCRCTTVPYFNDEWSAGERAARGDDGKTYYVPADTKFNQWKNGFVDGSDDSFEEVPNVEEIIDKLRKKGIEVDISAAGKYGEEAIQNLIHLDKLTDEYNSTIVSYKLQKSGSFSEAGSAYMLNGKTAVKVDPSHLKIKKATDEMNLGDNQVLQYTYHEFAHSLSQSREKVDPEFWKEIRQIRKDYNGNRGTNRWFDIKISTYADTDVDEFFAEAFTKGKLGKSNEYTDRVLAIVDKYFGKQSDIIPNKFYAAKTVDEAEEFAKNTLGIKYVNYKKLPLETANRLNEAVLTLPDDVRPVFVGDSVTLESYYGGKLPRSSKNYYGVTLHTDEIHLGYGNGIDFNVDGYMVGISSSYKTEAKIAASKLDQQNKYMQKHGRKWFFNEDGISTPYHEMGHVYHNVKGIPEGFEADALRWAEESKCDMLKKPAEAWSEAWAAYHTKNREIPDYIAKYIENVSNMKSGMLNGVLTVFDDSAIMNEKIQEFKHDLFNGTIKTVISKQKESRHIFGSKEFQRYAEKMLKKDGGQPAYIREDLTIEKLYEIIDGKLGTGIIELKKDGSIQEFFDCDEFIGYYYDRENQKYIKTKRVQVKYSIGDGNIHIIPVKNT